MKIYCCGCAADVEARLTNGAEIYPHRNDLAELTFWKCDGCGNHVGCHRHTRTATRPLGVIQTPEIRDACQKVRRLIEEVQHFGKVDRGLIFHEVASALGVQRFHPSDLRTIEDCRTAYKTIQQIGKDARQ